jgi:zinc protease
MKKIWIIAGFIFSACVPRVDRGPVLVEQAQRPVHVIQLPDANNPNIYLQATIRAGSRFDPVGFEGLASLTAHALVEAGAGTMTGEQLQQALYPTGNSLRVQVHREFVTFRLRCHRDHALLCTELFTAVITQPAFEEEPLERLKDEAVYSITDGILSDEEQLGEEVLNGLLFEGHPYGHPVVGRGGTIPLLSAKRARTFYQQHYLRSSITVGVAGHYTDTHRNALQTGLEKLSTAPGPDLAMLDPVPIKGRTLAVVATQTPVTGFHLGHLHEVDRNHKDWPALYLATLALGAHRQSSGRLFETIRTQRGLNYGDYAYMEAFSQRGRSTYPDQGVLHLQPMFYLWLRPTDHTNGAFTLKLAIDELETWTEKGLSAEEFESSKNYALGHLPLEAQDVGRRLAYELEAFTHGVPNILEDLPQRLESQTLEQVNTAIRTHVQPEHLMIAAVSGEGATLVEQLTGNQPTPIEYANVDPEPSQSERDAVIAEKDLSLDAQATEVLETTGIFR